MQIFYILFALLFTLFSAGQLGRISFFRQEVNVYFYEVFVVIILLALFVQYGFKPLLTLKKRYKFLISFLLYLLLSYILSSITFTTYQNEVAFLYYLRLACYGMFFLYSLFFFSKDHHVSHYIDTLTLIFLATTILTSTGQYFLYPDLRNLFYAGWDPHLYRMVGVFLEPPISGAIYGLLFFYFLLKLDTKNSLIRLFVLLILFVFIILTFSRGTYLGFAVTFGIYFLTALNYKAPQFRISPIRRSSMLYTLIAIIILSGGIFVASMSTGEGAHLTRTSTIESRIVNLQEGIRVWQKNPLFGIGYNHIRYAREVQQPNYATADELSHADASFHSSFLIILVTGGIIGLLLFILSLYEVGITSKFATLSILFLSISSLTDNVILHPFILFLVCILIALSNRLFDK